MRARGVWVMAVGAGLAAAPVSRGQELVQVSYSWSEVVAGTLTPVASPNSVLEPGEGARIGINLFATINGTNAVGQTTAYTPPPPPGVGTVRGVATMFFTLNSSGGAATGTWAERDISQVFNVGRFTGNILNQGAVVDSFGGDQYVPTGGTINGTNPINDAWRGVWSPSSYQPRTVNWKATAGTSANAWLFASGVILQYGSAFVDPSDPSTEYALYLTKYLQRDYGTGVNIPIAPSPSGGVAFLSAAVWTARRRRR